MSTEQRTEEILPVLIPRATYRLQFHHGFTFKNAQALVPYLSSLGISHCYASPYLKARAGSHHGYDIVDHTQLNPEIGTRTEFDNFVATLKQHNMSQILDMVPNHMGIAGNENKWWLDVLENGQSSRYSEYFDIFWHPLKDELRGKVLLAFLGGHYGEVLKSGEIQIQFKANLGVFSAQYYQYCLPIDPKTYPVILKYGIERLENIFDSSDFTILEFKSLINGFQKLPSRYELEEYKIEERQRDKEVYKRRLAELCKRSPTIADFIAENVASYNGVKGDDRSFDLIHDLLDKQAYRLAYWQVASHEINYRRFFDINELAGLNTVNSEMLNETHSLVRELVANGSLQGLRIDHPDGLVDPSFYYQKLREQMIYEPMTDTNVGPISIYLVVEKILAVHEHLPEEWPVQGTTGYDFANLVNGIFIDQNAERDFELVYSRFIDRHIYFDDLLYERKKLIMQVQLSSELNVLAHALDRISEADRYSRDFTLTGLREALMEVVACFPVYRTYVSSTHISTEDKRYVEWAIAQAKNRSPAADISVFDFIRDVLLCEWPKVLNVDNATKAVRAFAMKFQQYTAPVMAKGLEDTCFYIYNRLLSLNEVGGDPRRFGVSVSAFHHLNQERLRRWPNAMLCTSSHDTKRSEDVRMRLNVLTEMPSEWRRQIMRWRQINRRKKTKLEQQTLPSSNDEYFLYQTLVGAWPLEPLDNDLLKVFRERIEEYMLKAIREAKLSTSWINPNLVYEQAMQKFVRALLMSVDKNPFLHNFLSFQQIIARYGMLNSLAQTTLKLTVPGMPDIYQGTEIWDFSLVDPDNRRPVDFALRQSLLIDMQTAEALSNDSYLTWLEKLLSSMEDGRIKLYITWILLKLRKDFPAIFQSGSYAPLIAIGYKAENVVAFAREHQAQSIIIVTGRLFYSLISKTAGWPLCAEHWQDTSILIPFAKIENRYINILTREEIHLNLSNSGCTVSVADALNRLPCAVLKRID